MTAVRYRERNKSCNGERLVGFFAGIVRRGRSICFDFNVDPIAVKVHRRDDIAAPAAMA